MTCYKDDLTNDEVVNTADLNWFLPAARDHTPGSAYDLAFPGLLGSITYHGDMNCNGVFNRLDYDAFMLRLTNPSMYYAYYHCELCTTGSNAMEGGGEQDQFAESGPTAAEMAALIKESVSAENWDTLIETLEELVSDLPDAERAEFWAEVLAELV